MVTFINRFNQAVFKLFLVVMLLRKAWTEVIRLYCIINVLSMKEKHSDSTSVHSHTPDAVHKQLHSLQNGQPNRRKIALYDFQIQII